MSPQHCACCVRLSACISRGDLSSSCNSPIAKCTLRCAPWHAAAVLRCHSPHVRSHGDSQPRLQHCWHPVEAPAPDSQEMHVSEVPDTSEVLLDLERAADDLLTEPYGLCNRLCWVHGSWI